MTSAGRSLIAALALLLVVPALAAASPPTVVLGPSTWGTAVDGEPLGSWGGTWDEGGEATTYERQWLLCDAEGGSCEAIDGADGESYSVLASDIGSTLRLRVTATNGSGSASAVSPWPIGPVEQAEAPASASLPGVYGDVAAGETLLASVGEWGARTGTLAYDFQWRRCDASGDSCSDIAGADGNAYVVAAADMAGTLRVRVSASNAYGSDRATSEATAVVPSFGAPVAVAPPVVTGEPHAGGSVYPAEADWGANIGNPAYTYQWLRCDSAGDDCVDSGDESEIDWHVVSDDDAGATLRVRVVATNPVGSATATSPPVAVAALGAPWIESAPQVFGTRIEGEHLTSGDGTWHDPGSFSYQWRRCDVAGGACSDIAGADEASYDLSAADIGATVRLAVTSTNAHGEATATSPPGDVVEVADAPLAASDPVVMGSAAAGQTLYAWPGAFGERTGALEYSYEWRRCDASGDSCSAIADADAQTYAVGAADMGSTLRVQVSASNAHGADSSVSAATDVVPTITAPANVSPPAIDGPARQGEQLTASNGEWDDPSAELAFQWLRCDAAGDDCVEIEGSVQHLVDIGDAGATLRVRVTATNPVGDASAASEPVPVPAYEASAAPEVSGTSRQGEHLSASAGTWNGSGLAYAYQWRRCDANGDDCSDVDGATGDGYDLSGDDVGATLRVEVTASGTRGSSAAVSEPSAVVVAPDAPSIEVDPVISGDPIVGSTLSVTTGEWGSATGPLTFEYAWMRCTNMDGDDCAWIDGADSSTYEVIAGDVGSTISVRVTASGLGGSAETWLWPTDFVTQP